MRAAENPMMRPALILIIATLVAGCAGLRPSVDYMTDVRYPPTVVVERLRLEPNRPYTPVAGLSYTRSTHTRREAEEMIAEEARRLGADAVVYDPSKLTWFKATGMTMQYVETKSYDAIAVRYTDR
jgi:hypothetical protein